MFNIIIPSYYCVYWMAFCCCPHEMCCVCVRAFVNGLSFLVHWSQIFNFIICYLYVKCLSFHLAGNYIKANDRNAYINILDSSRCIRIVLTHTHTPPSFIVEERYF